MICICLILNPRLGFLFIARKWTLEYFKICLGDYSELFSIHCSITLHLLGPKLLSNFIFNLLAEELDLLLDPTTQQLFMMIKLSLFLEGHRSQKP